MGEVVPRVRNADLVEVETDKVDLQSAVRELQTAVATMCPDDVVFEYSNAQAGGRSTTHLRLRCYRHRAT
jgi:hypothetical protein